VAHRFHGAVLLFYGDAGFSWGLWRSYPLNFYFSISQKNNKAGEAPSCIIDFIERELLDVGGSVSSVR